MGGANLDRLGTDHLSPLFGVRDLQKLGWLRLVTTADRIMVDAMPGVTTGLDQKKTLLALQRRYEEISGKLPELLAGDNPVASGLKRFI